MNQSNKLLSDIVAFRTYAKYLPHLQRRESFEETINRSMHMDLDKFPKLSKEIINAYTYVHDLKVMPSMRKLQFAGEAINMNNVRQYNCSFTNIDKINKFSEVLFLLLSGTGVGFSVQNRHISQLPEVKKPREEYYYRVHDSIEGWALALDVLIKAYFNRQLKPQFDFSSIRPKGSYLVTTGAKAPGPEPLRHMLMEIDRRLNEAVGRRLKDIEVHDIVCIISDCVLAGGIRRAALISLFDKNSELMLNCKSGSWWEKHPYRARANNSAVLHRKETTYEEFMEVYNACKKSGAGEPGIFWTNNYDVGTNPCFTGDTVVATADGRNGVTIKELAEESKGKNKFPVYSAHESTTSNQFGNSGKFKSWKTEIKNAVAFKTGTREVISVILSDGSEFRCTPEHLLATKDGRWVEAKNSEGEQLAKFYSFSDKNSNKSYRHINSKTDGHSKQYRMMWEFNNGKYNSNFQIDHIDENSTNDCINNLQLLSIDEHSKKSSISKQGESNPVFRVKNKEHYTWALRRSSIKSNGKRYGWSPERINSAVETFNENNPEPELIDSNVILNEPIFVQEIVWLGETEDVYDLTVDDNHNFYIITKTDDTSFLNSSGVLVHNCAEISLRPDTFCNLTTQNLTGVDNEKELFRRVKAATVLGTVQAAYTDFPFLEDTWKQRSEEDALIGVSFTGVADNGGFMTNDLLKQSAKLVLETNESIAKRIGINIAKRATTLKPEGNSSAVLGSASGIHDRHSAHYIRRVRMNKDDALAKFLIQHMPELMEEEQFSKTGMVVSIPIESPEGSITRDKTSAIDLFKRTLNYNINWVKEGHRSGDNKHNVSATISVKEEEWDELGELMWKHRESYAGISLLPYDGGTYVQAPFEEISKDKFDEMSKLVKSVDLRQVIEMDDYTERTELVACAGGSCSVSFD